MHQEVMDFLARCKTQYRDHFGGKDTKAVEYGAININGSGRGMFDGDVEWLGVDIAEGLGVDKVKLAHDATFPWTPDIVLCTEMLEHDNFWKQSLYAMWKVLKPGGIFILTCATHGREPHGTHEFTPEDSPMTLDYYENVLPIEFMAELNRFAYFTNYTLEVHHDRGDLYFVAIKRA